MSVNYTPSTQDSVLSQFSSSNFSLYPSPCSDPIIAPIRDAFYITNIILLLPLSVLVLNLGFQRWKQQRCVSLAAAMSFSDFFTYNMSVMELTGVVGHTISICSRYTNLSMMMWVGVVIGVFPWTGQMFFPILTCVDRYLAVVHPLTYMRLRKVGGARIRNISTSLIWLFCSAGMGFMFLVTRYPQYSLLPSAILMGFSLIAMTFCSLSVLCVLIRPRPGEACRQKGWVDQSKQRAFHTIIIIMVVLWFRFGGNLVCNVLVSSTTVNDSVRCVLLTATAWFNLPSSLVLPLLFLHRAGKLPGCKHNTESG